MSHLADAVAVWFNYTGAAKCLNLSEQATSSLDANGWDYQVIFSFDQLLILLHIYFIYNGFVNLFVFHLILLIRFLGMVSSVCVHKNFDFPASL